MVGFACLTHLNPREVLLLRRVHLVPSAALVIAAVAIVCSPQKSEQANTTAPDVRPAVDSAANRLLAALRTDSPDSLLALLADDVIIMPPNEPVLKGKAAVRTWYEAFVKQMHTSSLTITDRELLIGGDYATEVAGFEWTLVPAAGGAPIVDRGSYMQVWHRQPDGHWLFSREVWNSSVPLH
jgi:ketosteroid isomerase-like protein